MGLVVAAIGGPRRLSTQVRGVAEGFFVPLFFVVLGARLDVGALLDHPGLLLVTAALFVLNVAINVLSALATRQPLSAGLIATAQLGVPAAVVQIGLPEHVITPALGAAMTLAALATLGLRLRLGTGLILAGQSMTQPLPPARRRRVSRRTIARQRARPEPDPEPTRISQRARKPVSPRLTEGEGFEPPRHLTAPNGFQDRRIQPLCHPSGRAQMLGVRSRAATAPQSMMPTW